MPRNNHGPLFRQFADPLLQDGTPTRHMTATEKRDAAPGVIRYHLDRLVWQRLRLHMALRTLSFVCGRNPRARYTSRMHMARYEVRCSVIQLRLWLELAE